MLNIISKMGEISWLSSFKTVGGIKSGPVALCSFKLASNFSVDAGGRKGARCFFRENCGELIELKYFGFAWCVTEGLTLSSKRRDAGRIFAKGPFKCYVAQMGVGGGVKCSRKKRYEGARSNVISVTRGWVEVKFPGKKRYVTLEWRRVAGSSVETTSSGGTSRTF